MGAEVRAVGSHLFLVHLQTPEGHLLQTCKHLLAAVACSVLSTYTMAVWAEVGVGGKEHLCSYNRVLSWSGMLRPGEGLWLQGKRAMGLPGPYSPLQMYYSNFPYYFPILFFISVE